MDFMELFQRNSKEFFQKFSEESLGEILEKRIFHEVSMNILLKVFVVFDLKSFLKTFLKKFLKSFNRNFSKILFKLVEFLEEFLTVS